MRELLKRWLCEVQSGWERHKGQVDNLLRSMGPMPPETELEALGLWGTAVINPLPPLGVAPEIRVLALEATNAMDRLRVLLSALETSMDAMLAPRPSLWLALRRQPFVVSVVLCLLAWFVGHGLVALFGPPPSSTSTEESLLWSWRVSPPSAIAAMHAWARAQVFGDGTPV